MAMVSLLLSVLRRPSPRLSLSVAVLSRLSPLPSRFLPTSHLYSASSPLPRLVLNLDNVWLDLPSPPPNSILSQSQWDDLSAIFRSFSKSPGAMHRALSLYLPSYAFPSAVGIFRVVFLSNCTTLAAVNLLKMAELESESAVHRFLFPNFAVFCLNELQNDLKIFKRLMEAADLTKPHTWYPFDCPVKRKVNEEASENGDIKTIRRRYFWLTSSVSNALLDDLLTEEDEKNFSENPHIDNKTLKKTSTFTDKGTRTVKATSFNQMEGLIAEIIKEDIFGLPNPLKYLNNVLSSFFLFPNLVPSDTLTMRLMKNLKERRAKRVVKEKMVTDFFREHLAILRNISPFSIINCLNNNY